MTLAQAIADMQGRQHMNWLTATVVSAGPSAITMTVDGVPQAITVPNLFGGEPETGSTILCAMNGTEIIPFGTVSVNGFEGGLLGGAELLANKGQPNGYAGLDANALVAISQIPFGVGSSKVARGDDPRFYNDRACAGAAIVADAAIANTETVVVSYAITPEELLLGATFMVDAFCTQAGTNAATPTARIRVGTTTLTGNQAVSLTGVVGTNANPSRFHGLATFRASGSAGTVIGGLQQMKHNEVNAIASATATVNANNSVALLIEFTFISGNSANTYTFREASILKVRP